jgi:hypothetical protein
VPPPAQPEPLPGSLPHVSEDDQVGIAVIPIVWRTKLTLSESIGLETEIASFRASLSPADRATFASGHRLSRVQRDSQLASLPRSEIIARGLRFADEPVCGPSYRAPTGTPTLSSERFVPLRIHAILMDAWDLIDPLDLELVADAVSHGANMGFNGPRSAPRKLPNLTSARIHPGPTLQLIEKTMAKGHVAGWFPAPPFKNLLVNPVGVVDKPDGTPPWRLVEDLSQPDGSSVNDWTDDMRLKYDKIDRAIAQFADKGEGCVFIVFDKKAAYPSIAVRPEDHHLLGIFWPGKGFAYGQVLKFGAKRSAGVWECFGNLWQALIIRYTEADDCSRWVDDALTAANLERASVLAEQILTLSLRYRFTLDRKKFVAAQRAKYVGIIFDSTSMSLSIPLLKREAALKFLRSLLASDRWTRHQVQSLLGTLHHFTTILQQCRGFLSRLLRCVKGLGSHLRFFNPTPWILADIAMWIAIISSWSGSSLSAVLAARKLAVPALQFRFDASPNWGLGIVCITTGDWIAIQWTQAQLDATWVTLAWSSTALEALAMLAILINFPHLVRGRPFEAITDARNLDTSVFRGYSTSAPTDDILRMCAALQCHLDCIMTLTQEGRDQNKLADALSKNDVPAFKSLATAQTLFVNDSPSTQLSPPPFLSQHWRPDLL